MAEAVIEEYVSTLNDLKQNSKPMINVLTMLAVDNIKYAKDIVGLVESRIQKASGKEKLPVLYLMDSIIKNKGGVYLQYFSSNLVQTFVGAFAKVDEKTRESMFKLRSTWNGLYPDVILHGLDKKVKGIDPAWPIITPAPASPVPPAIYVNPKFIKKDQEPKPVKPQKEIQLELELQQKKSEDEMRKALIEKQQQLLQLKRKELEFELEQTKLRLEAQNVELSLKNHQLEAQSRLLASVAAEGPQKPVVFPDPVEDSPVEEQPWMQQAAVSSLKLPVQVNSATAPVPTPTTAVRDPRLTSRDPRLARRDPRLRTVPTNSAQTVAPQVAAPQIVKAQPKPAIPAQITSQNPLPDPAVNTAESGTLAGKLALLPTPTQPTPAQPTPAQPTPAQPTPAQPRSILKNAKEKPPEAIVQDMSVSQPEKEIPHFPNLTHPALRDEGRRFPDLMVPGPGPRMPIPPQQRDGPMNYNGPVGLRTRRDGPGRPGPFPPGWRDFPPEHDMRMNDYTRGDRHNERTYKDEFGRDIVDRRDDRERRDDFERRRRIDRMDREREQRRRNERLRDTRRDERNCDDRRERSRRDSRERDRDRGKNRSSRRRSASPHGRSRSPRDRRERDRGTRSDRDKKESKSKEKKVDEARSSKEDESQSDASETKKSAIVKDTGKPKEEIKEEKKSGKRKSDVIDATNEIKEQATKKAKIDDDKEKEQTKRPKNSSGEWEEEPWCERLGPSKESPASPSLGPSKDSPDSPLQGPTKDSPDSPLLGISKDSPDSPLQDVIPQPVAMVIDKSPPGRRVSIDPSVKIPKELSAQMLPKILENAEKQLDSGQIDHKQHQDLLCKLSEVYKFQQQQSEENQWQHVETPLSPEEKDPVGLGDLASTSKDKDERVTHPSILKKGHADVTTATKDQDMRSEKPQDQDMRKKDDTDMRKLVADKDDRKSDTKSIDDKDGDGLNKEPLQSGSDIEGPIAVDQDMRKLPKAVDKDYRRPSLNDDQQSKSEESNSEGVSDKDLRKHGKVKQNIHTSDSDKDDRVNKAPVNAKQDRDLRQKRREGLRSAIAAATAANEVDKDERMVDKQRNYHKEREQRSDFDMPDCSRDFDDRRDPICRVDDAQQRPPRDYDHRYGRMIDPRGTDPYPIHPNARGRGKRVPLLADPLRHPDMHGPRNHWPQHERWQQDQRRQQRKTAKWDKWRSDHPEHYGKDVPDRIRQNSASEFPENPADNPFGMDLGLPSRDVDERVFQRPPQREPLMNDTDHRVPMSRSDLDQRDMRLYRMESSRFPNGRGRRRIGPDGRPMSVGADRNLRHHIRDRPTHQVDLDGRRLGRDRKFIVGSDGNFVPVGGPDGRRGRDHEGRPGSPQRHRLGLDGKHFEGRPDRFMPEDAPVSFGPDGRPIHPGRERRPIPLASDGRPILDTDGKPVADTLPHAVGPDGRPLPVGPDIRPLPIGPDGRPLPIGPDGRPIPIGPDGRPIPIGPDGRPLPVGPEGPLPIGPDGHPVPIGTHPGMNQPLPVSGNQSMQLTMEMIVSQAVQNVAQMIGRGMGMSNQRFMTPMAQVNPTAPNPPTNVFPVAPPIEPSLPPQPAPIQTQTDVNSLFAKLLETGIITKKTVEVERSDSPSVASAETAKEEPVKVEEKPESDLEEEEDKDLIIPPITFDLKDLKERYPGVIKSIYSGTQCKSCGLRFTIDQMDRYRKHLDWHFKLNRKDRDDVKARTSRRWYTPADNWVVFESVENLEEGAESSFFEEQALQMKLNEFAVSSVPIIQGNDKDDICKVCHEPFQQFWDEDEEQWQLKDAVRIDNKTYHPTCYQDAKENSLLETPTPSDGMTSPPFSFKSAESPLQDAPIVKLEFKVQEPDNTTEPMEVSNTQETSNVVKTESDIKVEIKTDIKVPLTETKRDNNEQISDVVVKVEPKEEQDVAAAVPTTGESSGDATATTELPSSTPITEGSQTTAESDPVKNTELSPETETTQIKQEIKDEKSTDEIKNLEKEDIKTEKKIDTEEDAIKQEESTEDEGTGELKIDTSDSPGASNEEEPIPVKTQSIKVVSGLPRMSLRTNKGRSSYRDWC